MYSIHCDAVHVQCPALGAREGGCVPGKEVVCRQWGFVSRNEVQCQVNIEKSFLNLVKSDCIFQNIRTKQNSICFRINRKMVNTIWFWFDLTRFRKDFSLCNDEVFCAHQNLNSKYRKIRTNKKSEFNSTMFTWFVLDDWLDGWTLK